MLAVKVAVAQDFDFTEMEYTPHQTTFQLFAPAKAKSVKVRIYSDGLGGKAVKTVKMKYEEGIWKTTIKGDLMNKYYTFDIGRGETPGVFAKAVGVNGQRGAIIDEETTFPEDWCCDQHPVIKSPADLVVYELHHRDFSIARKGAKYPGKFLALTEPWAINYLNGIYQYVRYGYVLQFDGTVTKAVYRLDDRLMKTNLIGKIEQQAQMEHELKAIIQQYMERMTQNRLQADI